MRVKSIPAVVLLSCILSCVDPMQTGFEPVEQALMYEASRITPAPDPVGPLKVVTWNIKYAGARLIFFWECNGTRYNMNADEALAHLGGIVAKINELDPDILLLQELDIQSKRSAYVDELQHILDNTRLNYAAFGSIWKADFVPSDGIGRINMGNAVLSRWPITEASRIALDLTDSISSIEKYFFIKRNILKARVMVPGTAGLWAVNIHTEPFYRDAKKQHIERFIEELKSINSSGDPFIAGGDLNEVPPGSPQWKDFPDGMCSDARFKGDDFTGEEFYLNELYHLFSPDVDSATYAAQPRPWYTFTGGDGRQFPWNRKLDYLFTNRSFGAGSVRVHQDSTTIMLSDHAPLEALMELNP